MRLVLYGHIREPLWLHYFKRKLPWKGGNPFGLRKLKDAVLIFETLASAALHCIDQFTGQIVSLAKC